MVLILWALCGCYTLSAIMSFGDAVVIGIDETLGAVAAGLTVRQGLMAALFGMAAYKLQG